MLISSSYDQGQHASVTISSWLPLRSSPDPAVAFQQALKAGIITVVGHRTLKGRDTILIRVDKAVKCPSSSRGATCTPTPVPGFLTLIWIDANTYLVTQTEHWDVNPHAKPVTVRWCLIGVRHGKCIRHKQTSSPVIDEVTWLRPTKANLALLTVQPPARFTRVPYSQMVQYLGPIS